MFQQPYIYAHQALRGLLAMFLVLLSGLAQAAPSACTALWGTVGGGTTSSLQYYNVSTNRWITATNAGLGATFTANSLGGAEFDGSLYFVDRTGLPSVASMYKATFSNVSSTLTVSPLGTISFPTLITYTNNIGVLSTRTLTAVIGATLDRDISNTRMLLYGTTGGGVAVPGLPVNGGGTSSLAAIGVLDPNVPSVVTWTTLHQTSSTGTVTYPKIQGSGDIFADQRSGALYLVTNTDPVRLLNFETTISGFDISRAQVLSTATVGPITSNIGAVGVDPLTGFVYIADIGTNSVWQLPDHTTVPTVVANLVTTGISGASDAGNCVAPPDPPTISKSFNPSTSTALLGTSTLTIRLGNPNKVPVFSVSTVTDTFPFGLVVATPPALTITCVTDGGPALRSALTTMTGVASATSFTIPAGALIPGGIASGGYCDFSIRVTATVANIYPNTIPAGAFNTTAGSNLAPATADFQIINPLVPNLPTISKSFNPPTSSATVGTATLTIVITNPNTLANTLTSVLTDNIPPNMRISSASPPTIACFSNGSSVATPAPTTALNSSVTLTIALGAVIPGGASGGSCSFTVLTTATTASFNLNTIPAGSLTMVSGANAAAATATFYLRVNDFGVIKYQSLGIAGATTTANIDPASGSTISYVIQIRNLGGVVGTRTFTDTLPVLVTPTLSVTPVAFGGASCGTASAVVAGRTVVTGTVGNAVLNAGCDITVVARVSVTATPIVATNTVGIYTVTGQIDSNASNNTATVVLTIKPGANLTITKTDGTTTLNSGSTNSYTITVANLAGGASANNAVVTDPAQPGLVCSGAITCIPTGGATCPSPIQLFVNTLQTTGLAIPLFPSPSTVTFVVNCLVTATGF